MEALGGLAVAERDIRALGTARADTGPPSDSVRFAHRDPASRVVPPRSASGAWRHARLALPVRQGRVCGIGYRSFRVETACATYFIPGGLIRSVVTVYRYFAGQSGEIRK
jgi:hypothetical protein